jgi:hypothetical protein
MAPDCFFVRIVWGPKMTDKTGKKKRESFSPIEILSVVAAILVLVMVAVPFPYASQKRELPPSYASPSRSYVDTDTQNGEALKSPGEGTTASMGRASQGSPFEVKTVGQREFCADMPGVVRYSTTGGRCKNGTLASNLQPHRDQPRP